MYISLLRYSSLTSLEFWKGVCMFHLGCLWAASADWRFSVCNNAQGKPLVPRYKGLFAMQKRVLFCTLSSGENTFAYTSTSLALSATDGCMRVSERVSARRRVLIPEARKRQAGSGRRPAKKTCCWIFYILCAICAARKYIYTAANSLRRRNHCRTGDFEYTRKIDKKLST